MVELEEQDDRKYLVYKADDKTLVEDAVVFRLKDPFAATALYTYSSTIMSFVELLRTAKVLSEEEDKRLIEIADYFHDKALTSAAIMDKRLPD